MKSRFGLFGCRGKIHLDLEDKYIGSMTDDIANHLHQAKANTHIDNEEKIIFHGGPFQPACGMKLPASINTGIIALSKNNGIEIDYDFSFSVFYILIFCLLALISIPLFEAPNLTWIETVGMISGIYLLVFIGNTWFTKIRFNQTLKDIAKNYDTENKIKTSDFFDYLLHGLSALGLILLVVLLMWHKQHGHIFNIFQFGLTYSKNIDKLVVDTMGVTLSSLGAIEALAVILGMILWGSGMCEIMERKVIEPIEKIRPVVISLRLKHGNFLIGMTAIFCIGSGIAKTAKQVAPGILGWMRFSLCLYIFCHILGIVYFFEWLASF